MVAARRHHTPRARNTPQLGESKWFLLPNRQHLRGGEVEPTLAQAQNVSRISVAVMWGANNQYDFNVIKNQIDWASGIGLNTVRLFLPVSGIEVAGSGITTNITLNQLLTNMTQVFNYLASKNMYATTAGDKLFSPATLSAYLSTYQSIGALCQSYSNVVVGMDIMNEAFRFDTAWGGATFLTSPYDTNGTWLDSNAATLRSNLTSLSGWTIPLTFSGIGMDQSGPSPAGWITNALTVWNSHVATWCDYMDFHCYALNPPANTVRAVLWDQGVTAKILMGEFGIAENASQSTMTAQFQADVNIAASRGTSGQTLAGATVWCLGSCAYPDNTGDYGIFNTDGTERTYKTNPIRTLV